MKIYSITYDKVLRLKQAAAEKYPDKIHFHDACGGQYFSLETPNDGLQKFIVDYFEKERIAVVFSEDNMNFHLAK